MLLLILAYLGGVLTVLSPCILPVLPFVFARADRPFARNGLPMLAGMVLTFAAAAMKRSPGAGELVRRTLGVLVLAEVAAIALGLDAHLLTRVSLASTGGIEQKLIDAVHLVGPLRAAARATGALPVEGELPSLAGAARWLNSAPLTAQSLRGKAVLVDFWTYSCINCIRALPYVRGWATGKVICCLAAPTARLQLSSKVKPAS